MSPKEASYHLLKANYDSLDRFLSRTLVGPQLVPLQQKREQLGERLYDYHTAMIAAHSEQLEHDIHALDRLIAHARQAQVVIDEAEETIEYVAKVGDAIDKVLAQLAKVI
ncbi:hypothetical protein [Salinivibrio sp. ES.052]|uniref:hypothetical protein n=1 Tax=Salinivibrio sp. ES.052 TaxID=1882823 RepID=UPI000925861A|nr:hypothetical protein [Salinivibrio sp. ES.052]SIN83339.1 hypothetical protein SAMN05444724_0780 [Salinivibrio sp. ES.052]